MSKEIENAIEETINTGYKFKLGTYFSDGWENCKHAILPNWGFMTLAVIMSIAVGITPFIGVFVLFGYVLPALMSGTFYYIHLSTKGEDSFGNFFKGFQNANVIGYFWIIILISFLISTPSIVYFYSLGLYDPIIQMFELIESGGVEPVQILALSQKLAALQEAQGATYKIVYYTTLIVSTTFSTSQMIGVPILVSSNSIGPIQALAYSFRLSLHKIGWLLLLYVILAIMNYLGALLMTFGLIVTIPFSVGIIYSVYRTEVLSKLDNEQTPLSGSDDLLDV
tara:strand:- start:3632 stop:4474 length:843 start_codon:yes stop_codon:yes gene_type:complete